MAGVRRVLLDPTKQAKRVENASKALVRWAQHNLRAGLFAPWAEQRQSVQPGVIVNAKGISVASPDANTRLMLREEARRLASVHGTNFGEFMASGNYAIFFSDAPEEFTGKAATSAMAANRGSSPIRHNHAGHSFGADDIADLLDPANARDRAVDRMVSQRVAENETRMRMLDLPETYSDRDARIDERYAPVVDTRAADLEALEDLPQRVSTRGLMAVGAAEGGKKPFFQGISDAFRRKPAGLKREIAKLEARIEMLRKKLEALEPASTDGVGTVGFLNAFVGEISDALDAVQPIVFICRQQINEQPASAATVAPAVAEASQTLDTLEVAVDEAVNAAASDDNDPDLDDDLSDAAMSAAAVPGATMGVGAVPAPAQPNAARAAAFRAAIVRAAAARRQAMARQQQVRAARARQMQARRAMMMRAMAARRQQQQQAAFAGAGAGAGAGYGASSAAPGGGGDMGMGGGGGAPAPSFTPMPAGDSSASNPYINPGYTDPGFGFDAPLAPVVADPYGATDPLATDPLAADPVLTDPSLDPALSLGFDDESGTLGFMNTFEYAEGVGAVSVRNSDVVQTIATFEEMSDLELDELIETHLGWLRDSRAPQDVGRRAVSRSIIAVARAAKGDFLRSEDGLRLVRNYVAALTAFKDGSIVASNGVGDIDHLIPPRGHNPYGTGLGRQYEGGYGNDANPLLLGALEGSESRHLTRDARRDAAADAHLLVKSVTDRFEAQRKQANETGTSKAGISEGEAAALFRIGDSVVKRLNQAGIPSRRPGASNMSRHLTRDARRVMQRAASEGIEIGGIGDFGDFDTINRFTGAFIDAPAYVPDDEYRPQSAFIQYPVMGGFEVGGFLDELANDDGPTAFGEPVGIGDINNLRTVNDLYRYRVEPAVIGDINFVPAIRKEDRLRPIHPALFSIDYPFGG